MEIIFGVQNKLQSYDPFIYFYAFREACFAAKLIIVSGYGFFDKHINDNLENAFKINLKQKLVINCYNNLRSLTEDKYKEEIKSVWVLQTSMIFIFLISLQKIFQ